MTLWRFKFDYPLLLYLYYFSCLFWQKIWCQLLQLAVEYRIPFYRTVSFKEKPKIRLVYSPDWAHHQVGPRIEVPATMTVFGFCNTLLCAGEDPLTKLYWDIEYEHSSWYEILVIMEYLRAPKRYCFEES